MMNNRGHLPAGQQVQGVADMGPAPSGPPPRRGGRPQHYPPAHGYHHGHHHQHVAAQPMYPANYMANPYAAAPYYVPAPYQNGAIPPTAAYMPPYGNPYVRSPPAMTHFVPMQQTYPRHPQHSPIVSSPYHPPPHPPVAAPVVPPLPHTPSSTHSHVVPPPPMTPPVQQVHDVPAPAQAPVPPTAPATVAGSAPVPAAAAAPAPAPAPPAQPAQQPETQQPEPQAAPQAAEPQEAPRSEPSVEGPPKPSPAVLEPERPPFRPPLPWLSHPDLPFPQRTSKLRRRKKALGANADRLKLPGQHAPGAEAAAETQVEEATPKEQPAAEPKLEEAKAVSTPARSETPSTQDQPTEDTNVSSPPTTPSSVQPSKTPTAATSTPAAPKTVTPAVPAVPVVPALPKGGIKPAASTEKPVAESKPPVTEAKAAAAAETKPVAEKTETAQSTAKTEATEKPAEAAPQPAPAPPKPKLWTGLFAKSSSSASTSSTGAAAQASTNGNAADGPGAAGAGSFAKQNATSLAHALQAYRPVAPEKLALLEPRGLVNTGNMCYMNSVLQVLIHCIPFYEFLDQVGKKAAHSFKSETPLLDAMVMFLREFKAIETAPTSEQLRKRVKPEELEKYGDPFTPEFVYEAIRTLPRFASMRRGHQQDAQEFLGFLLEGLHDECARVISTAPASTASTAPNSSLPSPSAAKASDADGADDWLEVGRRQRPAVTRSSGHSHTQTPITKIFGGQLRSELRVPGNKNSVTLEPYQPLQLDIGAPEVRNIIDALRGLTRPEVIHGDFNSPHGKDVKATKQVFIESVPPVLILHLKRFQFDAEGYGTVKVWKKVGYPLEFEFPREVLSRQTRNTLLSENSNPPRYRLIGVVYHHGKNASGGHYTVDVRRQDSREWIRIDDTIIRRVRDEDVAEGGSEEDSGKTDARKDASASSNRFSGMNDEDTGDDEGWKQAAGGKKWSSVVNGTPATNGHKAKPLPKDSIKDNKVAYLLFYQRI